MRAAGQQFIDACGEAACVSNGGDEHLRTSEFESDLKAGATRSGDAIVGVWGGKDQPSGPAAGRSAGEEGHSFGAHRETKGDVLDNRALMDVSVGVEHSCARVELRVRRICS